MLPAPGATRTRLERHGMLTGAPFVGGLITSGVNMRENKENAILQIWDTLEQEGISWKCYGDYRPTSYGEKVANALEEFLNANKLTERQLVRLNHLLYLVSKAKEESLSE
jgi:multimeric flavodoxin WrbA